MKYFFILLLALSLPAQAQFAPTPIDAQFDLRWTAPSTRENGKALALSEIKGFDIIVIAPDGVEKVVRVLGANLTRKTIPITQEGEWRFAILARDTDGLESALSETVAVTAGERSSPSRIEGLRVLVVCQPGSVCHFYARP